MRSHNRKKPWTASAASSNIPPIQHSENSNVRDYNNRILGQNHNNCPSCAILAFDEGWANYYTIAVKDILSIPNTFTGYQKGFYLHYSAENADDLLGEDQEIAVMRLLWDFHDPIDITEDDCFAYGGAGLFLLLKNNNIHAVSDLWKTITNGFTIGSNNLIEVGKLFSSHGMGITENELLICTTTPPRSFRWKTPISISNPDLIKQEDLRLFNESKIVFYKQDGTVIFESPIIYSDANGKFVYVPDPSVDDAITQAGEKVFWCILIRQQDMSKNEWYRSSFTKSIDPP